MTRPSSRRLHHSRKQKLVIGELEERFAAASLQHDELLQQNNSLHQRTAVLADLVKAVRAVDAAYEEAADIKSKGSQTLSDMGFFDERIQSYSTTVQQLAMLVSDAMANPTDTIKQQVLARTMDQLLNISIVVPVSVGPVMYNRMLEAYFNKAFTELQVPEEEHWHNVAASLHMTPDQVSRAAVATRLVHDRIDKDGPTSVFKSVCPPSSTHPNPDPPRPRLPSPPAATAPHPAPPKLSAALTSRARSTPRIKRELGSSSSSSGGSGSTAASDTCHTTPQLRSPRTAPSSSHATPATPDAALTSSPTMANRRDAVTASASVAAAGEAAGTGSAAASEVLADAALDPSAVTSLDKHMQRLTYWYHVLNMYIMTILLTPTQAAQAFVNSYPLWASGPAIVTAICEQHEQQQQQQQQGQGLLQGQHQQQQGQQ